MDFSKASEIPVEIISMSSMAIDLVVRFIIWCPLWGGQWGDFGMFGIDIYHHLDADEDIPFHIEHRPRAMMHAQAASYGWSQDPVLTRLHPAIAILLHESPGRVTCSQ